MPSEDTIFALATAPGRAAVAVMRISGPASMRVVTRLAGEAPPPRQARLRRLRDEAGAGLDEAVVLWLPGPESYTGEDSAELQLHGGPAVVDAVSTALVELGLRLAEPGEFTRRAFENGRLDLTRAEAVADLVEAETEAQRRQALAQLGGALGRRHEAWRAAVLEALAVLEAAIDFPDEDVPADVAARARPHAELLEREFAAALADAARGERVREGYRIALVGAPNAGKSSLLNALVGRDAAIVTATPGTTRDVIEQPLALAGFRVLLADMAGLRDTAEEIESEGVRRARTWAEAADLRLWVVDAAAAEGAWREAAGLVMASDLLVLNKTDLPEAGDAALAEALARERDLGVVRASVKSGEGLEALRAQLEQTVIGALGGGEFPAATRLRHRLRLQEAHDHVLRALGELDGAAELAAEDLRMAGRALGRISGRIDPEEVLDRIFASFCIGK